LRQGLTLIEALIVMVLVIVLVGLLVPLFTSNRETAHHIECTRKLSQILGACIAYGSTEDAPWPRPWPAAQDPSTIHVADAHEARLVTIQVLSILARVQDLPNSLFTCANCRRPGPALKPAFDRAGALAWGAGPERAASYAWDWASPADPGALRVIGADRSPTYHKGRAAVVFGDTHAKSLKVTQGTATGMVTEDSDGTAVTAIVGNRDATGEDGAADNIYSPTGDGAEALLPTQGDNLRSWVK
jgi:hypothetical protein